MTVSIGGLLLPDEVRQQPLGFTVLGTPQTQGSAKAFVVKSKKTGKSRAVITSDNDKNKGWRQVVRDGATAAIAEHEWERLDDPAALTLHIYVARPKSHFGTGRNAHVLKTTAPARPTSRGKGDLDKFVRSIGDALTDAHVWEDDALVVDLWARKFYVGSGPHQLTEPGVVIEVTHA